MVAPSTGRFAAVDLGASSGRVMVATVAAGRLELTEVHRFANQPVVQEGTLCWDATELYRQSVAGLRLAVDRGGELTSIGIDSWAIDYGLLDGCGALIGNPVHYRDRRTRGVAEQLLAGFGVDALYAETGIQLLAFNTIFQLAAARGSDELARARQLLLIPDLLGYWLTGRPGAELTNASTTQLVDIGTGQWSATLVRLLQLPAGLLPEIRQPGSVIGRLTESARAAIGAGPDTRLVAVGSHDTASAVVAVPAESANFGYISCGTWSLVGLELERPVLTAASRAANFSNEAGVDGTIRYLRNVMGLWLLQESLRTWTQASGRPSDLDRLLAEAARLPAGGSLVDPDDPAFLEPGDMPARIARHCRDSGQPVPRSQPEVVRCILDSLALAYRRRIRQAGELAGRPVEVVHLVGGGARNILLCQLAADAIGLPVVAGPAEATALGNVLVQARAAGVLSGGLAELRALLRQTQPLRRYRPRSTQDFWADAERRVLPD
ncbi:MAG: rhamnulokinase [Jatrophihabitans sp.]